jgi:hypothetical protein
MANEQNLKRLTTKKAREIGKLGGVASGEAKRKKKLMSQIYADILVKNSGSIDNAIKSILGDSRVMAQSAKVNLLKEIRESTEPPPKKRVDFNSLLK